MTVKTWKKSIPTWWYNCIEIFWNLRTEPQHVRESELGIRKNPSFCAIQPPWYPQQKGPFISSESFLIVQNWNLPFRPVGLHRHIASLDQPSRSLFSKTKAPSLPPILHRACALYASSSQQLFLWPLDWTAVGSFPAPPSDSHPGSHLTSELQFPLL